MQDRRAPLRPLDEAADAVRQLDEYETRDELGSAVVRVEAAVERALRLRLRADPGAPDEQRLTALSAEALPHDELIRALRSRDLLSLEAAGSVHELRSAAERARSGPARPSDADVARTAVRRLRSEFEAVEPDDAGEAPAPEMPVDGVGRPRPWVVGVGAAVAGIAVTLLAWAALRGGSQDHDAALAAFRAGRFDSAAAAFERLLDDRPEDVSTLLYLGRVYRRLDRRPEAAEVLRTAVRVAPDDPDVRRELGHLFMDLRQPRSAAEQYERAIEQEPQDPLNWAALIRALRAAEDPRAEQLLAEAPPEVRAALGSEP
jgi:tetratricopeptide (TPR) repeat protein